MASFNLIRFSPPSISPSPKTFSFIFTTQGLSPSLSLFLYLSICLSLSLFSLLPSSFRTPRYRSTFAISSKLGNMVRLSRGCQRRLFPKKKKKKKTFHFVIFNNLRDDRVPRIALNNSPDETKRDDENRKVRDRVIREKKKKTRKSLNGKHRASFSVFIGKYCPSHSSSSPLPPRYVFLDYFSGTRIYTYTYIHTYTYTRLCKLYILNK